MMLISAYNFLLIIVGFGLLIFVHELGHFIAARWAGIRTEAFAVGMGPVAMAWRKGIGITFGSTHRKVVAKTGKAARDLDDAELRKHGLGETEYSLRWLPFGGFVKMLGQEDANPNYVSDDPRSYNRCPIGKRMVVVSAGVVMNLLLAAALFIVVFMVGVRFEAPVVGQVSATLPAGRVMPSNAGVLGVTTPGLQPGDRIVSIDGKPARTFADVQLAAAMGRPDQTLRLTVERPGVDEPLHFSLYPQRDEQMGMLAIGVAPAASTTLLEDRKGEIKRILESVGLAQQGVQPGMTLVAVDGEPITTYQQFDQIIAQSDGEPVQTTWARIDDVQAEDVSIDSNSRSINVTIELRPDLAIYVLPDALPGALQNYDRGLLGLSPLVKITAVAKDSPNHGILEPGDAVLRVGEHVAPRLSDFLQIVRSHDGDRLEMEVLRNGERIVMQTRTAQRGLFSEERQLGVGVGLAQEVPYFAQPLERVRVLGDEAVRETPIAGLGLGAGSRIAAVNGQPVENWTDLREGILAAADGSIELTLTAADQDETYAVHVTLRNEDIDSVRALGWSSPLMVSLFEPVQTVRTAGKNPARALVMGVEETHKMVMLTYLTIDRLFRGTVGVEQLRGPIGIIDIGVTVADKGLIYLLFLLAVISVNLAVLNFLPLPIVDGGLFLFLIYEKIKGQPPSLLFQNIATVVGLCLIGALFLVVTYNDILRLVS